MPRRNRPEAIDFEAHFHDIDENRLVQEWVKQPKFVFDIAIQMKDANRAPSEAKANLEVVKAEVSKDIRANPEAYDIDKLTEKVVETTTIQQTEYNDSLTIMLDAKEDVDVVHAALNAAEHKKRALEALVSLHGQNYFSTPQAKEDDAKEYIENEKKRVSRRRRKK